ncbi:MAG: DUF2806 domain-containing protein [Pedobacter sp.]|nr:DUF2806 domain-containing protein [Pedobacter sp.]
MTDDSPLIALRQRLADKLWHTLFGSGEDIPLLAPWQLRSRNKNQAAVREAELAAIQTMLDELDDLSRGRKVFNHHGEIVAAPEDDSGVELNPLIELADEDPLAALRVPGTAAALQAVRLEADIRALRHSLYVRRIALRADLMIENSTLELVSERAVDADWLLRWQAAAGAAIAADFQDMWARVLVDEVRQPGTHSLRSLAFLATLSRNDMNIIRFMTRLDLGGFICRDVAGYFQEEIHAPMFAAMETMGLLQCDVPPVVLKSAVRRGFRAVLRCQDKALYIEGEGRELKLGASLFTALGREVNALFVNMPDTAYLFALGNELKRRGYRIDIGDWATSGGSGLFSEKLSL